MSGTEEPGRRAWPREAGDDLERATENVLEGWPTPPPSQGDEEREHGLAFDPAAEAEAAEEPEEREGPEEPEPEEVLVVRLPPGLARAFSKRALAVVGAGRPSCPFCGGPIDPEGHLCPRANGFRRSLMAD